MTAASRPGGPLVEARALAWTVRGRSILGPLDLAVRRGECLVVIGPNGAGKTTLLRLLAGLLEPSAGELAWRDPGGRSPQGDDDGRHPYRTLSRRELARRIAYVPQIRPMEVPLTVEEVVLLGRYPHLGRFRRAPRREDFAAVDEALALVEISHLAERRVEELSGGERQAVYVAAALAQEAEVLILDEPTTHLDPRHQRDISRLLPRLRDRAGRTVVTATHDLALAARLADRVVALRDGAVLATGAPHEVLDPEVLDHLFDAPFEWIEADGRRLPLLAVDREAR